MKKILLFILGLGLCSVQQSFGQAFVTAHDTVFASTSANSVLTAHNALTTTQTTNLLYTWKVIDNNLPSDWLNDDFGICDGTTCYNSVNVMGGQTLFDTVRASKPIDMKISVRPGATNGTYFLSIQAKDVANTTNKKLTYVFNKWPNNVTTVSRSEDDVTVYPNPARESINVVFDENLGVKQVAVYNLIGKMVNVYRVTATSAKIDLSDVPSGIYFLRLMNAQGQIVATRKFTHQ